MRSCTGCYRELPSLNNTLSAYQVLLHANCIHRERAHAASNVLWSLRLISCLLSAGKHCPLTFTSHYSHGSFNEPSFDNGFCLVADGSFAWWAGQVQVRYELCPGGHALDSCQLTYVLLDNSIRSHGKTPAQRVLRPGCSSVEHILHSDLRVEWSSARTSSAARDMEAALCSH